MNVRSPGIAPADTAIGPPSPTARRLVAASVSANTPPAPTPASSASSTPGSTAGLSMRRGPGRLPRRAPRRGARRQRRSPRRGSAPASPARRTRPASGPPGCSPATGEPPVIVAAARLARSAPLTWRMTSTGSVAEPRRPPGVASRAARTEPPSPYQPTKKPARMEMARRKGTFWQREKGPLCRVVVATWPDGAERREATSRRVPINAFSSVERGPSGSVGRP